MITKVLTKIIKQTDAPVAFAHCDGPCGVYDPASARIAAEAVLSMSKKMEGLADSTDIHDKNNFARYANIKEEQAKLAKDEVLVLWTDYFKPEHLEKYPDLHDLIWQTTKLLSKAKQHVDPAVAQEALDNIQKIHDIFWESKGKDVAWYTAS